MLHVVPLVLVNSFVMTSWLDFSMTLFLVGQSNPSYVRGVYRVIKELNNSTFHSWDTQLAKSCQKDGIKIMSCYVNAMW